MTQKISNFEKWLSSKPDVLTTRDVAAKYNITVSKAQQYAGILKVYKDPANAYLWDAEKIARLDEFLKAISRY